MPDCHYCEEIGQEHSPTEPRFVRYDEGEYIHDNPYWCAVSLKTDQEEAKRLRAWMEYTTTNAMLGQETHMLRQALAGEEPPEVVNE